ncbi:MAG: polysaccharide transporter [Bacilli bacterium]|nr:polysaccharide transporter [Bacilli bacterium]
MGSEYLGVNGLFTNIISILSIAELGIGGTIVYHLYKPIAEDNKERIKILLKFYKIAYRWIALTIFLAGMILLPFIHIFIGDVSLDLNFKFVYFLFLIQTVFSYLLTYKRSILYAYQKNYVINIIHIGYILTFNVFQILILLYTKNYYLYLIIKIAFVLLENIIISIYANKLYPFIKDKEVENLDSDTKKDVFKRVRAQFLHTIGGAVINGTDNIVISKFLGVYSVGIYSNYNLIITQVFLLFSQFISSITASVGDLLVKSGPKKLFDTYKKIRFANYWISVFCCVSVLVLMEDFITIWIGAKYLLPTTTLFILVINLYQKIMRSCNDVFLSGAGICVENKYVPIIESIINIVCSIILVMLIGLPGVFIGTLISSLTLWIYSYPKFVYKNLFKRKYFDFIKETAGYLLLFLVLLGIMYLVCMQINSQNIYINLLIKSIVCLILPNLFIYLIFKKTDNYVFFKQLFLKKSSSIISKIKKSR